MGFGRVGIDWCGVARARAVRRAARCITGCRLVGDGTASGSRVWRSCVGGRSSRCQDTGK
eukprot:2124485-Pleurochrysis_carterae.AAC.1